MKKRSVCMVHHDPLHDDPGTAYTISVVCPFDQGFIDEVKRLPARDRYYDEDEGRWVFAGRQLEAVKVAALRHFDGAYLIEGNATTCLKSGVVTVAGSLF